MPRKKATPPEEMVEQPVEAVDIVPSEVTPTSPPEPEPTPVPARAPTARPSHDILTISDQERAMTALDSEDEKWQYLAGAQHRREILTGIVSGIEGMEVGDPKCAIDLAGIRVVIPGHEMFMDDWPLNTPPPKDFRIRFARILGATVDFIPIGVDLNGRAAIGSRRAAMKARQKAFYATDRVKEGILVACRIISVGNNRVTVDVLGVDTVVDASDISHQWFNDVSEVYGNGDLAVAKVMRVGYDPDTDIYKVKVSMKEAQDNPDRAVVAKLQPGSDYFGVVTGVAHRTIFVRLQCGANAKTRVYRTPEMPNKGDTVGFRVRTVNEEQCMAFGFITRIVKHGYRLR